MKVEYSDDFLEKRKQSWGNQPLMGRGRSYTSYGDPQAYMFNIGDPLRYKDVIWKFQNEYRYYLFAIRSGKTHRIEEEKTFIDLPIIDDALSNIRIRLYPNCTEKDESEVKTLIKEYLPRLNPDNCVQRSELDEKYVPKKFKKDE